MYSKDDADLDIATISIRESLSRNVTLIGEDSDLLILLLYYCSEQISPFKLWYKSDKNKEAKDNTVYDIYRYRDILGVQKYVDHSCSFMHSVVVILHLSFTDLVKVVHTVS